MLKVNVEKVVQKRENLASHITRASFFCKNQLGPLFFFHPSQVFCPFEVSQESRVQALSLLEPYQVIQIFYLFQKAIFRD